MRGIWAVSIIASILILGILGSFPSQLAYAAIGDFISSFDGTAGGGTQFNSPENMAVDSTSRIIVVDISIDLVQIFDSSGSFLGSFDGTAGGGTQFSFPRGLTVDSNDRIIVSDLGLDLVQIFDSTGSFVTSFDGTAGGGTQFDFPLYVTVDSNDRIIVSDLGLGIVQIFDSSGSFLSSFDGTAGGGTQFSFPVGVTVDSNDRIIVSDRGIDLVQIFDSSGSFLGISFDGTAGGGTQFTFSEGITVDSNDRIIVSDLTLGIVQIFDSTGSFLTSFDGTAGGGTQFLSSRGITVNPNNSIIVSDVALDIVQIFEGFPLQINFNANLDGSQEVPPVSTTGTGMAFFELNEAGTEIRFRIEITNLDLGGQTVPTADDVNGAHIHLGALGVDGGIVVGFINPSTTTNTIDAVAGTIIGTIDSSSLTGSLLGQPFSDLVNEMISGNAYVNIHTIANSGGEIRGQIEPCLPPSSGNWVVDFDCTLVNDAVAPANVIIQGGSVLTIPSGLSLDIDFTQFNLTVVSDSGVLIESGGKIT